MKPLDFRSDTVTRPTPAMRKAMAEAEVGDDVLEGDPTLMKLEATVAERLGLEAGLWVPTGSMGNLIALMLHLARGDRFFAPAAAHVLAAELGTAAWLAGGMPVALDWAGGQGRPSPAQIQRLCAPTPGLFALRSKLLCLENTHNAAGGAVTPLDEHVELVREAKEQQLLVHLDGARIWNAAVALTCAEHELAAGVDTAQVCLSKGLGAPMGSVLCGTKPAMLAARRLRKMLGGGVRQGGVMGAAGLVALSQKDALANDHVHARELAEGLRRLGLAAVPPETNIVLVPSPDPPRTIRLLAEEGVLAWPFERHVRFVTHRDVGQDEVSAALARVAPHVAAWLSPASQP
jgi:threonine aldolase